MNVGILNIQGSIEEHHEALNNISDVSIITLVNTPNDLKKIDGLIIPGGESTVIRKFLHDLGFVDVLKFFMKNKCVFGTCAGMIVLADDIIGELPIIGGLNATVIRNSFGSQINSFVQNIYFDDEIIEAVFIRAPIITKVAGNVEVLANYDDKIVAVRTDKILATSFHPELTDNSFVHKYFINMIKENKND